MTFMTTRHGDCAFRAVTRDESETTSLAHVVARECVSGDMIALRGPVGAGKTAFARAFIRALCGPETQVPSPTFTLVQTYDGTPGPIWHMDLYRLSDVSELDELGFETALDDAICLVEWPERLGTLLPKRRLDVTLTPRAAPQGEDEPRDVTIVAMGGGWDRLAAGLSRQPE